MLDSNFSVESNQQPLLSILIPTKNRAYYLRYAIQSAINVSSDDIEIIVSENYGDDDGWQVANSFSDPRLSIIRPDHPLPMHENFEYLLQHATGRWITFLGDDDGFMPYAAEWINFLAQNYSDAEIIYSSRATFQWPGTFEGGGGYELCASSKIEWRDSKLTLKNILRCHVDYIDQPQMYSGGFFRDTLVERIRVRQGGQFFLSAVPDAFSCAAGLLYTFRYLYTDLPMVWTGTSPSSDATKHQTKLLKNRLDDYLKPIENTRMRLNPALGSNILSWPLTVHFYEAYLPALNNEYRHLRLNQIKLVATRSVIKMLRKGAETHAHALCQTLGVRYPNRLERVFCRAKVKIEKLIYLVQFQLSQVYLNGDNPCSKAASHCQKHAVFVKDSASTIDIITLHVLEPLKKCLLAAQITAEQGRFPMKISLELPPWDPRNF